MSYTIYSRYDSTKVIYHSETADTAKGAVVEAIKSDSDLSRSDLHGSDLSRSNLSRSNLSNSDLSRSNLSRSNLSNSNLSNSDLSHSNLRGSDLSGADLRGSNLHGSDLSGSNLSNSDLSGADLRGSNLSNSNLSNSNLRGADLQQLLTRQRVCRDQAAEIARLKEELAQAHEPKDTTYNGWSNYETWWMALIFDNDRGLQAQFADDADNLVSGVDRIDDFKDSMIDNLAAIMRDWLGEFVDDSGGHALMKDMCNTFIQDVDFEEIARHYIDDAIENNK